MVQLILRFDGTHLLVFHKEGFQQTAVSHCRGMIANAYIFPCFPRTNHYTNGLTQLLLGHSIVHHKISSSFFQVMAWCRFGANPFKIIIISNFRLGCCPILIQWGWQHQATPNTGSPSSCPLPEPILTSSQYNPFLKMHLKMLSAKHWPFAHFIQTSTC